MANGSHRDDFVADCRVRLATDLFVHTWNPVVLAALSTRPHRRRELRDAIGGISDKVLTDTLRRLERSGLIDRHAYAESPPRVDYELTELGRSLVEGPIAALGGWTIEHGDALAAAQERFDAGAHVAPTRRAGSSDGREATRRAPASATSPRAAADAD